MPWEELGKSKVSIDQSSPGISNGVALTGSNIEDGSATSGVSFEKDINGYNVLRTVPAAVFGYDTVEEAWKMTMAQKDAVKYAIDNIIDIIGLENIRLFLPMWETSGTVLKDLINPDINFKVSGATFGQPGPLGNCLSFDGVNDYCVQNTIAENRSGDNEQKLAAPTAVAVQKLPVLSAKIGMVCLRLKKRGTPDGSLKIEIRESKDGVAIENGTSFNSITSSTHNSFVMFYFGTSPLLSHAKTYYIALVYDSNTNADTDNCYIWDRSVDMSTDLGRSYYDGTSWTDEANQNHYFEIYNDKLMLTDDFSIIAAGKASSYGGYIVGTSVLSALAKPSLNMSLFSARDVANINTVSYPVSLNQFNIVAGTFSKTKDTKKINYYFNGSLKASGDGTASTPHEAISRPWAIGNVLNNSGIPYATGYFTGSIGPVIITKNELSAANIGEITSELLTLRKLGVAI